VIEDVDGSLRKLLSESISDERAVVSFDAPTQEWASKLKGPVVNLFLYDVREDLDGRRADWDDVRSAEGRVVGRQPPARRYALSYFVSAWSANAEEEHHLLSEIIRTVPQREIIPYECLEGVLAEQEMPVVIQVGIPGQGAGMRAGEMWSALGVPPRASMELVVLAPFRPPLVTEVAPPAEEMSLGVSRQRGGPGMRAPKGSLEDRLKADAEAAAGRGKKGGTPAEGEGVPGLPRGKRWAGFRISERHEDE